MSAMVALIDVLELRPRKLRARSCPGSPPILALQSRAGVSYGSFSDRSNCRFMCSQSLDGHYCRRAADDWSRGLRRRAILDQYGYRGFDFPRSAMASARTGVVKGFSEKRHSGCRESDDACKRRTGDQCAGAGPLEKP